MKEVFYLRLPNGEEPARNWMRSLDFSSRAVVQVYIDRVAAGGGKKNVKSLKGGVFEIKIHSRSGLRVYFSEEGKKIILLLLGGDKGSQKRDIATAKMYRRKYVQK